jgi:glucose/arabinose dehydrogenase
MKQRIRLGIKSIPILSFCLFVSLISCNYKVKVPKSPYPINNIPFTATTIIENFTVPYGIAIVEDDEYFITDRVGKLFHFKDSTLTEISGTPEVVTFGTPGIPAIMHGGLMDISLHPNYKTNAWIYIAYLPTDGFVKVSRFKIKNNAIIELEDVFKSRTQNYSGNGMRIEWEDSTHFFLNIGNSDFSNYLNPVMFAQDLNNDAGKIHRLKYDGSIPLDNPILDTMSLPSSIWSYGHRDVQGLYYEATTQTLFGVEHGPKGGDELNIIEKGKNYGWPLYSDGINYDGLGVSLISKDSAATFTVFPEHIWTVPTRDGGQAIAPACLWKVDGSNISEWNGHFLLGSLAFRRLMIYNRETDETFGLNIEGRVRTIKQLPSGDFIALIERNDLRKSNGKIVRIGK